MKYTYDLNKNGCLTITADADDQASAPILGIRGDDDQVVAAWGFMDYAVRSFVDDLIERGKAVFVS